MSCDSEQEYDAELEHRAKVIDAMRCTPAQLGIAQYGVSPVDTLYETAYEKYVREAHEDRQARQMVEDLANRRIKGQRLTSVGHRVSQTLRQEDALAGRLPEASAQAVMDAQKKRERRSAKRMKGATA